MCNDIDDEVFSKLMLVQNNDKRHNLVKKARRSSSTSEDSYPSSDIDIGAEEVKLPKLPRLEVPMFDANNLQL